MLKIVIATDLPKTAPLTAETLREIAVAAREWREAFAPVKAAMESKSFMRQKDAALPRL